MIEIRDSKVIRFTEDELRRLKTIYKPRVEQYQSWFHLYMSEAYPNMSYYSFYDENTDYIYVILSEDDTSLVYEEVVFDEDGKPFVRESRDAR